MSPRQAMLAAWKQSWPSSEPELTPGSLMAKFGLPSQLQVKLCFVSAAWISQANKNATAAKHQTMTAPAGISRRVDRTSPDK